MQIHKYFVYLLMLHSKCILYSGCQGGHKSVQISIQHTVLPLLQAAASNYSDEFFTQNLLSEKCILVRLLFEGGFYSRAAI